jgi:hypothetical protein
MLAPLPKSKMKLFIELRPCSTACADVPVPVSRTFPNREATSPHQPCQCLATILPSRHSLSPSLGSPSFLVYQWYACCTMTPYLTDD